jgi:hypothetical protein
VDDTDVLALGVTLLRRRKLSFSAKYTLEAASGYTGECGLEAGGSNQSIIARFL